MNAYLSWQEEVGRQEPQRSPSSEIPPPGTSSMLIKFVPPETLARFGGAKRFADAVDRFADVIGDPATFRNPLFGETIRLRIEFDGDRRSAAGKKMDSGVS